MNKDRVRIAMVGAGSMANAVHYPSPASFPDVEFAGICDLNEERLKRGPITYAVCEFYKCSISPMYDARDHMMDDCVHSIDTVRWMCGGEVVSIESHGRRIGTPDINFICAILRFDNGSTGYVINSWSSGRRVFRVQMHAPAVYVDAEVEGKVRLYADGDCKGVEYDCFEVAGSKTNWGGLRLSRQKPGVH